MTATPDTARSPGIRSLIPARIDRLPWSKFHTRLVIALGVAWVLDGLEITIASNVGPDLTQKAALNMSASAVADIATWYLIGEVIGALFFGQLSDKLGRKNLFMITLGVYLIGSGLTALTPRGGYWFIFLYGTRVIAGMGIGGEYAAINSAIDEMIPAKFRGRVDLAVNGTYWAGAFLGTIVTLAALNHISTTLGWRIAYLVGPVLALVIIFVRRHLPESPRWQIMHGREKQAEASIAEIEQDVSATKGELPPVDQGKEIEIRADREHRLPGAAAFPVQALPEPGDLRRDADDHPVVPVQRDLLHLRAGPAVLLPCSVRQHPLLLHGVLRREPARPADHRAAVRHDRPPQDRARPTAGPGSIRRPSRPAGDSPAPSPRCGGTAPIGWWIRPPAAVPR